MKWLRSNDNGKTFTEATFPTIDDEDILELDRLEFMQSLDEKGSYLHSTGTIKVKHLRLDMGAKVQLSTGTLYADTVRIVSFDTHTAQLANTNFSAAGAGEKSGDFYARMLEFGKSFEKGEWYDVSIPFDIYTICDRNGKKLEVGKDIYIRKYNGDTRAKNNYAQVGSFSNWDAINDAIIAENDGVIMKKNEGYLIGVGKNSIVDGVISQGGSLNAGIAFMSNYDNSEGHDENLGHAARLNERVLSLAGYDEGEGNTKDINKNWNMIGNPYLTMFDLKNVVMPSTEVIYDGTKYTDQWGNLVNGEVPSDDVMFYVYEKTNKAYRAIPQGSSYELAPGQAFFVQGNGESATLQWPGNEKNIFSTAAFRSTETKEVEYDEVDLQISGIGGSDVLKIRLHDRGTTGNDFNLDGYKIYESTVSQPMVFTKIGDIEYAVSALPRHPENNTTVIPLSYFTPQAGTYTFSYLATEASGNIVSVVLYDKISGNSKDLMIGDFSFISSGKATNNTQFELRITNILNDNIETKTNKIISNSGIELTQKGAQFSLKGLSSPATITFYDTTGRILKSFTNIQNGESFTFKVGGSYLMSVKTDSQLFSHKNIGYNK